MSGVSGAKRARPDNETTKSVISTDKNNSMDMDSQELTASFTIPSAGSIHALATEAGRRHFRRTGNSRAKRALGTSRDRRRTKRTETVYTQPE